MCVEPKQWHGTLCAAACSSSHYYSKCCHHVDIKYFQTASPSKDKVPINQATVFMHFFNISVFHIHNKYIKLFSSYDTALNIFFFYTHHFSQKSAYQNVFLIFLFYFEGFIICYICSLHAS